MRKRDIFKRKEITIGDGNIYYVQQFPPFEGMRILGELQKVILPSLGGAAVGLKSEGLLGDGLAGGLMNLSENLDADTLEALSKKLLNPQYVAVKIEGEKEAVALDEDKIAEIFTGRYFDMLTLCFKIVQVNFFDFTLLSSLPIGVVTAIENIKSIFRANLAATSSENFLSTEQSKAE